MLDFVDNSGASGKILSDEEKKSLVSIDNIRSERGTVTQQADVRKFTFDDSANESVFFNGDIDLFDVMSFKSRPLLDLKNKAIADDDVLERRNIDLKNGARGERIYNEGVRYGGQAALRATVDMFKEAVRKMDTELSAVYGFEHLMIAQGKVVPPIITLVNNIRDETRDSMSHIKIRYEILQQAKFRRKPPSFREYLDFSKYKVKLPSIFSIPLTENEKTYWANGVYAGWIRGKRIAVSEINNKVTRLNRDYLGMIRFHTLLKKGVVSNPVINEDSIDVSKENDGLNIGETILSMSVMPDFNVESNTWKAIPEIDKLEIKYMKFNNKSE